MPSNVEIKARVEDVESLERRVAEVADGVPTTIDQRDTFFRSPRGRLKLREFPDGTGELIFYERADSAGPAASDYLIHESSDARRLRELLGRALGIRGTVEKQRHLSMHGQTRIHVDRVRGLGDFMELEVVLTERQTPDEGQQVAERLMRALGVRPSQLVETAYIDLLEEKNRHE